MIFPKLEKNKFVGYGISIVGRRGTVPAIKIGDNVIHNLEVVVFPNNSAIFTKSHDRNHPGIMGMQCFQGTVMVLDFKYKSLWVKRNNGKEKPERSTNSPK
jgi:hypothetical protein